MCCCCLLFLFVVPVFVVVGVVVDVVLQGIACEGTAAVRITDTFIFTIFWFLLFGLFFVSKRCFLSVPYFPTCFCPRVIGKLLAMDRVNR